MTKSRGGGKQPGAGRKAGVGNKVNEARKAAAIGNGPTPLEVIMEQMRYYRAKAERLRKKGGEESKLLTMMDAAMARAEAAAPYIHPKLQSVTQKTVPFDPSKLTEQELEALIPIVERLERANSGETTH